MAKDKDLADRIYFLQKSIGAVPGPMDSFLAMRGIKTLHLRMERHAHNAQAIAERLEKHPNVERVIYPGLPSHPQHALAKRQMLGFGGMISFVAKGGLEKARSIVEGTKIFALAESLGGVESLIEHPAIMTHASVPAENSKKTGNRRRLYPDFRRRRSLRRPLGRLGSRPRLKFSQREKIGLAGFLALVSLAP